MNPLGWLILVVAVGVIAATILWFIFSCPCEALWRPSRPVDIEQPLELKSRTTPFSKLEISTQILSFQKNIRGMSDVDKHATIKQVQHLLISHEIYDDTFKTRNCLIIGVDATPATQAGYCINPFDKSIHFYVIKRENLPWVLHDPPDSSEFEMKNLNFALTVWKSQIVKCKYLAVYTDNFSILGTTSENEPSPYGQRAKDYMEHFVSCEGVTVVNRGRVAVNKNQALETFAKYIQPADDLSRWRINEAIQFLSKMYGIDGTNVQGTHQQKFTRIRGNQERFAPVNSKPWYEPTPYHREILDLANVVISTGLRCGNLDCCRALTSSLRRNQGVSHF